MSELGLAAPPQLHVPDEPEVLGAAWYAAVLDGAPLVAVLTGEGGLAAWLWSRWRALAAAGLREADFTAIVTAYRRELWLWMAGERTWEQSCGGLVGRIGRRISA